MALSRILVYLLLCCTTGVRGQVTVGQVTVSQVSMVSASPGESVSLSCQVTPPVFDNIRMAWYVQREGGAPRLLVYLAKNRAATTPPRFQGSGKNTHFTLSISNVQQQDAGVYYCQSRHWRERQDVFTLPHTLIQ